MRVIKKGIAAGFILFLLIIGFIIAIPVTNNYCAYQVEKELKETTLPSQTELIESVSVTGKLNGNGNGMQYFGAILIRSELSLQELEAYYSGYRSNDWEYVVEEQKEQRILAAEHVELCFDSQIDDDNYYIVYSWGDGITFFKEMDIRGH